VRRSAPAGKKGKAAKKDEVHAEAGGDAACEEVKSPAKAAAEPKAAAPKKAAAGRKRKAGGRKKGAAKKKSPKKAKKA